MTSKSRWPALVSALLIVTLSGCAAAPSSSPSPGFTSEAEAFAAAEKTYRAYVDALNDVDLSNPDTFEAVYAWTTGEANANERRSLSEMHASGWRVEGDTVVRAFYGLTYENSQSVREVQALICSDVSGVSVRDESSNSVVSADRPDVYALEVAFRPKQASSTGLAVSTSVSIEDSRCVS